MFGKNPVMKSEARTQNGRHLQIVKGSPFLTIQGEGPFAGQPAVFVRLHGCNLRCWFCDTEFSDPSDPTINTVTLARMVADESRKPYGAPRELGHLSVTQPAASLVVITGGEPMRQNIAPLCKMLVGYGFIVQVETAGTLWVDNMPEEVYFVVSPKTPNVHKAIAHRAKCVKYVIGADTRFTDRGVPYANTQAQDGEARPLASIDNVPVYYSPLDEYDAAKNKANHKAVAMAALRFGGIAGVQMHKLFEVD